MVPEDRETARRMDFAAGPELLEGAVESPLTSYTTSIIRKTLLDGRLFVVYRSTTMARRKALVDVTVAHIRLGLICPNFYVRGS